MNERLRARIICVGNRYLDLDAAGPRVFDALARRPGVTPGPSGSWRIGALEICDGGLGGLNLLGLIDGAGRAVLVDAVRGYVAAPPGVVVLSGEAAREGAATANDRGWDHGANLGDLLRLVPLACDAPPELSVVGVEGRPSDALVEQAASVALALAAEPRGRARGGEGCAGPGAG